MVDGEGRAMSEPILAATDERPGSVNLPIGSADKTT